MDRRDKLLHGIDVASLSGMEIGALCRPFLTRDNGEVTYVDHADTAALREKYRNDPDVQLDKLVNVDAVWGTNTLADAVGKKVDYVVASHVIEHVPDLIGWLEELRSVLNDGGEVRLIVPDRRFTFDYLRYETRLPEVVYARLLRTRLPLPNMVLEYVLNVVKLDGGQAWRGEIDEATLEHHHTLQQAEQCATSVLCDGKYHDIHCWIFTPRSFGLLFAELASKGLMTFECTSFFDTALYTNEFFVGMRPTNDAVRAAQSWREMAVSAQFVHTRSPATREPDPIAIELREKLTNTERELENVRSALSISRSEHTQARSALTYAESAIVDAEHARNLAEIGHVDIQRELSAILGSRTWKLTANLIRVNRSLRKLVGLSKS